MKELTLAQIAEACGGTLIGGNEAKEYTVTGVEIDSRRVKAGDLFVAIPGEKVDGHKFIPDVLKKGAYALSQQSLDVDGAYILVEDTVTAMKRLARFYRNTLDIKVVGITGSVGKTSTKEMIASVLDTKFRVHKTQGNFNNGIGLPLTIFQIEKEHQVAVLEMGISEFGEMHELADMAQPDIMVITNIGLCHLENLKTRDGILKAKTESFAHLKPDGVVILNGDDDKLSTVEQVAGRKPVFYGIKGRNLCETSFCADAVTEHG
nr:UDP-N-acetylmuramoyl-tripeptide--D-alanyl-D-alanine ligase [Roseburia sp. OM04-10AA]